MRHVILFPTLLLALAAQAGEYTPMREVNLIHSVIVNIPGNCCPTLYLSTKVGHLENGTCVYEQQTQSRPYGYCGPQSAFPLDGEQLAQMVGADYTCAATVVTEPSMQYTVMDEYQLTSVNGKYVATTPPEGTVVLPLQCAGG